MKGYFNYTSGKFDCPHGLSIIIEGDVASQNLGKQKYKYCILYNYMILYSGQVIER